RFEDLDGSLNQLLRILLWLALRDDTVHRGLEEREAEHRPLRAAALDEKSEHRFCVGFLHPWNKAGNVPRKTALHFVVTIVRPALIVRRPVRCRPGPVRTRLRCWRSCPLPVPLPDRRSAFREPLESLGVKEHPF